MTPQEKLLKAEILIAFIEGYCTQAIKMVSKEMAEAGFIRILEKIKEFKEEK